MHATARAFAFITGLGLAHVTLAGGLFDFCDHSASRNADVDAAGAQKVVISARAGDLSVRGTEAGTRIYIVGEACAQTRAKLDAIKLETRRDGAIVYVRALVAGNEGFPGGGWLNLVIDLPKTLHIEIEDSSGDIEIRDVGSAEIEDSSGDQVIDGVAGDLVISDSSGDVRIRNVSGLVSVRDSTGDIEVADVAGAVIIPLDSSGDIRLKRIHGNVHVENDGSGDISVADVNRDIRIDRDSSGDIRASDVGGNLTVARDSSGDIVHRHVLGNVDIPRRRHDD